MIFIFGPFRIWITKCYDWFRIGPRFPPMSDAYNKKYRDIAKETAKELGFNDFIREGVYSFLTGPTFETVTECRLLRLLGSDATGTWLLEVIWPCHTSRGTEVEIITVHAEQVLLTIYLLTRSHFLFSWIFITISPPLCEILDFWGVNGIMWIDTCIGINKIKMCVT